jgi:hypothetical protein
VELKKLEAPLLSGFENFSERRGLHSLVQLESSKLL